MIQKKKRSKKGEKKTKISITWKQLWSTFGNNPSSHPSTQLKSDQHIEKLCMFMYYVMNSFLIYKTILYIIFLFKTLYS